MMHKKLETFIETTQAAVNDDMRDSGVTMKALFLFDLDDSDEKTKVGVVPIPPAMEGDVITALVNKFRPEFDVVAMVAESWKGSNPDLAPSEDPEREECIMMVVYNRKDIHMYISDMNRISDTQVIMGEWTKMDTENIGGRMAEPYKNPVSWN